MTGSTLQLYYYYYYEDSMILMKGQWTCVIHPNEGGKWPDKASNETLKTVWTENDNGSAIDEQMDGQWWKRNIKQWKWPIENELGWTINEWKSQTKWRIIE